MLSRMWQKAKQWMVVQSGIRLCRIALTLQNCFSISTSWLTSWRFWFGTKRTNFQSWRTALYANTRFLQVRSKCTLDRMRQHIILICWTRCSSCVTKAVRWKAIWISSAQHLRVHCFSAVQMICHIVLMIWDKGEAINLLIMIMHLCTSAILLSKSICILWELHLEKRSLPSVFLNSMNIFSRAVVSCRMIRRKLWRNLMKTVYMIFRSLPLEAIGLR